MTTKATTIANRLHQIRDRSQPATKARSATRVAGMIYACADVGYLDGNTFTATFPDQSLLVVRPAGPVVVRGRAKTDTLDRARQLPPQQQHRPAELSDSSQYDAIKANCIRATS